MPTPVVDATATDRRHRVIRACVCTVLSSGKLYPSSHPSLFGSTWGSTMVLCDNHKNNNNNTRHVTALRLFVSSAAATMDVTTITQMKKINTLTHIKSLPFYRRMKYLICFYIDILKIIYVSKRKTNNNKINRTQYCQKIKHWYYDV